MLTYAKVKLGTDVIVTVGPLDVFYMLPTEVPTVISNYDVIFVVLGFCTTFPANLNLYTSPAACELDHLDVTVTFTLSASSTAEQESETKFWTFVHDEERLLKFGAVTYFGNLTVNYAPTGYTPVL